MIEDHLLTRFEIFSGVAPDSIRQWLTRMEVREYEAGSLLLDPDSAGEQLAVLFEGQASIHTEDPSTPAIATLTDGESYGEFTVYNGRTPPIYVTAQTETRALLIPKPVLLELLDHSHEFCRNLLYQLASSTPLERAPDEQHKLIDEPYELHASVDSLTALYNLRWIQAYFQRFFERSKINNTFETLTIVMVDLDGFRSFNQALGTPAGDQALKRTADAIRESLRPTDIVARFGGDKFLTILSGTLDSDAMEVAERIRSTIEKITLQSDKGAVSLSASLGIAQLKPTDNLDAILAAVDSALHMAKSGGRNRVCINPR
jgi:diguanylate cyclase (GGDEF)-like protein